MINAKISNKKTEGKNGVLLQKNKWLKKVVVFTDNHSLA